MENNTTQSNVSKRTDIQQVVTDTIIQQLEAGTIPWQKPWKDGNPMPFTLPKNFHTGNNYRGVNILLLWAASQKNGYTTNDWGSFKQWSEKNEHVKKGEKGSLIVYYDTFARDIDGEVQKIPYLKSYNVFNRSQLAGYNPEEIQQPEKTDSLVERIEAIDVFLENTKAVIECHNGGACYIPSSDKIKMPYLEMFKDTATCTATEGFYSSTFHEVTHWTGAKHRLDRTKGKRFGDHDYATEELIAEFGSAFLCAEFGIGTIDKGDHAGYIDGWLKVLKEDKSLLLTAASQASKAVDYLKKLDCN